MLFFVVPFFFVGALGSNSIVWEGCFLRFTLVDCYTRPVPCGIFFRQPIVRIDFLFLAYLGRRLAFGEGVIVDGWWHGMVGWFRRLVDWPFEAKMSFVHDEISRMLTGYIVSCACWNSLFFVLSSALALPTSHERGKVDAAERNDVLAVPVFLLKHDLNIWDRYFIDDLFPKPNTFSPKKRKTGVLSITAISMAAVPKWKKKTRNNPALRPVPHYTVSKVLEEFMNVSDVIEAREGRVLWPVGLMAVSWNWGYFPKMIICACSLSMFPKDIWSLWMIHAICHLKGRATSVGKLTLKVFH